MFFCEDNFTKEYSYRKNDATDTAVTVRAILQLKVYLHVPCKLFLIMYFLGTCFTPKKDRALKHAMFTNEVIFQWAFVFIRYKTDFTMINVVQDK